MMLDSRAPAIIACDDVARSGSVSAMVALAEHTGASVYTEAIRGHVSFPNRHPNFVGILQVDTGGIRRSLSRHDFFLMTDGPVFEEVWYDEGGFFPEGAAVVQISQAKGRLARKFPVTLGAIADTKETLKALLAEVSSKRDDGYAAEAAQRNADLSERRQSLTETAERRLKKERDFRPMTPRRAIHEIQQSLPGNAVVVDESISASFEVAQGIAYHDAGDYYGARGGGIGQGLAGAIGVKAAVPDRPVVCISGDGSAMYSIQALWSAAHHDLPVVFIILSNREYRVLKHNLDTYRQRFSAPSDHPYPYMDLMRPELGFTALARGMGVAGEYIEDPDRLGSAIDAAITSSKPYLIEVEVSGKR